MQSHRPFFVFAVVLVIAAIGYAGYVFVPLFFKLQAEAEAEARRAEQIALDRVRLSDALGASGAVARSDILRGFWYTYSDGQGNESVGRFDIDALAAQGLSDEEIAALVARIGGSRISPGEAMRRVAYGDLPPALQFHNDLYAFRNDGSFLTDTERLKQAVASEERTSGDLFRLSYVAELAGDYKTRDALNAQNCEEFGERCASDAFTITVSGVVVDVAGDPVQGAEVSVAGKPEARPAKTNTKGAYRISVPVREMEKIRISAAKRNFSDGVVPLIVLQAGRKTYDAPPIQISSAIGVVTLDTEERTVTGAGNEAREDGSFVIRTSNSAYDIPAGAIVRRNGTPYQGVADVYLYEFTDETAPESLLAVDTFDQVMGYAGDLMKSFGMPYIQFFTPDGEELHVLKSKPMTLTYKIADMEGLRTNRQGIYAPVTEKDMELLVSASEGQPYRIDREFLINNRLLRFPAFWVFDREAGVWENVGITVLDTAGTIRSPFYTLNDTRSI